MFQQQLLVGLEAINGLQAKLLQMPQGDDAGLFQMAHLGFGEFLIPDPAVAHLNRIVAVGVIGFDLGDNVAFSETYHSHRNHLAGGLEVGHHAEFVPINPTPVSMLDRMMPRRRVRALGGDV